MLQAPTNQDLGRGPTVPRCDLRNDRMIESMTAGEGAVRFQLNLLADAESEQLLLIQEGVELDLVHGGGGRGGAGRVLPASGRGVGHPARPRQGLRTGLPQRPPPPLSRTPPRPGDEVEIDGMEAEVARTPL